ncbi:MAG: MMPL family transporter, partial [Candidatus Omnitrophica bacterium]|nr:MMPL family transporter [Candidatus Omnitrophota bacterium]
MNKKLAIFVIQRRLFFVIFPLLIALFCLFSVRHLRIATNLGDFVPKGHPAMTVQDKLEEVFGGLNQVSIVIKAKKGTIFTREILEKIYRLTEDLYFTEGVNISRINGLAAHKMRRIQADASGLKIERLMPTVPESLTEIAIFQEAVKRNPMVYGVFVSRDLSSSLIQADFFSGIPSRTIFERVRTLTEAISSPEVEVYYSGRPILEGWLDYYLPRMLYLFMFSFFVLAGLLYLSFRSKRGVLIPLTSALMASLWGLASLTVSGANLSPSTILVPFLVMALGVSHSVQFLKRYYEEAKQISDRKEISLRVLQSLFSPATVSLLTDGAGFLTLLLIPFPLLQTMALAASTGVFSLFFTTIFFIPSLLSYLPLPVREEVEREERAGLVDRLMVLVSDWLFRRRRTIFWLFGAFAIFGLIGVVKLRVGDEQPGSPALYPESHYNQSESFINKHFGGTDPYYIMVAGRGPEALLSTEVLKEMESLQGYLLKSVPEAG